MPNQRDVAKMAGVSSASVSRYLTDFGAVKADKAEKIQTAINALGYKPDYFARSLRTGRSHHAGILLPGIGPFYWEVLQGIQDCLARAGYFSTILYTRDIDGSIHSSREGLSRLLNNNMLDGVIFFPLNTREDKEILKDLHRLHEHIVIVDRDMEDSSLEQVFIDNCQAGRQAADELLGEGHRELLFIHGVEDSYAAVQRRRGFCDRLSEFGISLGTKRVIPGDYTSATAYQLTKEKLPQLPPFTGVFAANDSSAIGFLRAAREYGLDCPRDFSLIGFDNNQEYTPYLTPSLTTFQQPLNEMGNIAAERLVGKMDRNHLPGVTTLQTRFIRRESLREAPKLP